jgi:phosphoribosylformimino-5-aminoimidazole carboxamide ribotide isomerase
MLILPVLDLKKGVVVRGIAGRRQEYQPITSRLTASCQPLDVARAFRDHYGLTDLYLADLDAIAGASPSLAIYAALRAQGFRLRIDAGVCEMEDARPLASVGVEGIVAGLETIAGPRVLRELCGEFGSDRILFSLDLQEGRPLGNLSAWNTTTPWSIAEQAVQGGVRNIIVLDLARVGISRGTGTEDLCARVAANFPEVTVIGGGGVRNRADLDRLERLGVKAVLVASALHEGKLTG